jgi:hypothetical protein
MDTNTAETIMLPTAAVNDAFSDDVASFYPDKELAQIPGFRNPETYGDPRKARSGRIPSIWMITRISDGKIFGAEFSEPADDNFYTEAPFSANTLGGTEFREVQKKTRVITEEYAEFA